MKTKTTIVKSRYSDAFSSKNADRDYLANSCFCERYVDDFSFIFTGKEKDPETGYSNFGARYLEHELMTTWLSVDPMADKYPSISPYAYCAWNPIKLVDPEGNDLEIPCKSDENHEASKRDILSLVSKWNKNRVVFKKDGSVLLNTEGLTDRQIQNDVGLSLLKDMIESDMKFLYEASDDISDSFQDGKHHDMIEKNIGVVNASNKGKDSSGGYYEKPKPGYDGHVILAKSGTWKPKEGKNLKTSLLFHELAENYYRTHFGYDYADAHMNAIQREGFHYHNQFPGIFFENETIYIYKGQKANLQKTR